MLQLKEKLREQKASEEATDTKPETPETANGEQAEEQTTNEGEVAEGETTPTDGAAQEMTDQIAEGHVEETPSPEEKANGQLSTTANAESPILNGNCAASDTDEEGGAGRNEDQSKLTNGEVSPTANGNQSDDAEPKVNGVSGSHDEEDNTKDGALTAVSKSGSKVGVSTETDTQSEATMINGGNNIMTNGEVAPARQDSE